ncbi:DUF4397 domain-containing protein [Nocardioides sp. MAHUQ-72]|uniref:DUF4397 domain-containing protein n=1 Tax=unclassified Nocardioides TaxID=2615069 RepID=UPI00361BE57F
MFGHGRLLAAAAAVGAAALASPATVAPTSGATAPTASLYVVQALPGASVTVTVDGREREAAIAVGRVVGPLHLAAGSHQVELTWDGGSSATQIRLGARSSTDLVLHRPASVRGDPVTTSYRVPTRPIGPGKARLVLAHTATVPPADARFDGKVVFTDIANGEFARADVPAGAHRVALLPTGATSHPILGPLGLSLAPRTVTMVYAVGSPTNGSMDVVSHVEGIGADGTAYPVRIDTGSAGLVAGVPVTSFTSTRPR